MDEEHDKSVVWRFNEFINARDVEGLAGMMTDDHVFIDAEANSVSGKAACVRAWAGFFAAFPDYRNNFADVIVSKERCAVLGRSFCSDPRLDGPAIWVARVRGNCVSEWRVYEDNVSNRSNLGVG